MSPFCALQAFGWCPLRPSCLRSALSFPQQAISTSAFFGLHEEVEVQCVRWSNFQFQHHDIRKCRKPWRRETSTFTRSWTCQCFKTPRAQTRNSCHHLQGRVSTGQNFETIHVGTPVFSSLPGVTVLIFVVHQDVIMDYLVRSAHIRSSREIWMNDSFSWKICALLKSSGAFRRHRNCAHSRCVAATVSQVTVPQDHVATTVRPIWTVRKKEEDPQIQFPIDTWASMWK